MIYLHILICCILFLFGILMRYGLARGLPEYLYRRLPGMATEAFNEYKVRRFLGETSIKLGCIILMIVLVGIFQSSSFTLAIFLGWICFVIVAVGSVTFMDKTDIFKKLKK